MGSGEDDHRDTLPFFSALLKGTYKRHELSLLMLTLAASLGRVCQVSPTAELFFFIDTFLKSSPGHFNVQPKLRTSVVKFYKH